MTAPSPDAAPRGFFITGTDTGVGKTRFAVALLEACARQGMRAVGMKPVAAGAEAEAGVWVNDDVRRLRAASGVAAPSEWVNPFLLREAVAPHIAAERAGVRIDIPRIVAAHGQLAALAEVVVVEGVGGWRVPLSARRDTADLAAALGLPVFLVVGMRLGCLNHALLTAEAIRGRGLTLAGWVASQVDPAMALYDENIAALAQRLGAAPWAELSWRPALPPGEGGRLISPQRLHAALARAGYGRSWTRS